MKKITIIGLGKMGSAICNRLLQQGDFEITTCKREDDVNEKVGGADIIIIAVKPQNFDELASSITTNISDKLIISIMAGVTIESISQKLKSKKIIRSMPNLGSAIGEGVTGWIASAACSKEDKDVAEKIFAALGHQFEFEEEQFLDTVTAISGSGPAYFFYLTQLLEEKAIEFGFNKEQAERLAKYTFFSAAKVMEQSDKNPQEWVNAVASKGGITEQALTYMKENKFDSIFKNAVEAAKKRSEELH